MKLINFKIMGERAKMYVAWVQFAMIGVLFIQQTTFDLVTTILLVAISLGTLTIVDFRWILPAELKRTAEKNPVIMSIQRDVSEIKEMVKRGY